ncbi:MAG: radical SAM protein [Nanoarchaeota archaeon]|nr:radical SAM protein [Nanoarchaeota archaeon]
MKTKPAYTVAGEESQMIILKTNGCSYGQCTMCGFNRHAARNVSAEDLIEQFEGCYVPGVKVLQLLGSGSFFDDIDVPEAFQRHIVQRLMKEDRLEKIVLESRPEYLTDDKVAMLAGLAKCKEVYVAIGLESRDDRVRNQILNKGISITEFEEAARTLARQGVGLQAYALVKPHGLDEAEAIEDAVNTAKYVFALGKHLGLKTLVSFQPAFIAPDTELEKLFVRGEYDLLSLWSVVEILKRTCALGVVKAGLDTEGLTGIRPEGCARCDSMLREAIALFCARQDPLLLDGLYCPDCQK